MSAKRIQLVDDSGQNGGAFFPESDTIDNLPPVRELFPSGSTLLDLVNGGGWPVGRIVHGAGASSAGKTQVFATEAMVNFDRTFPGSPITYVDAENAYDAEYAVRLGLPSRIKPRNAEDLAGEINTIEAFAADVEKFCEVIPKDGHGLYVLDSFDALSDESERERTLSDATYGGDKAKLYGAFCRKNSGLIAKKNVTLMVISQVRDNMGAGPFAPKERIAGGRALKFYASVQVWLHHTKRLARTVRGIEREIGVLVRAKCEKNKISAPFRECTFPIL